MNNTNTQSIQGIVLITGEHDTGKTTLALEAARDPSRICFFDDDVKGRATIEEIINSGIKFGRYVDLTNLNVGKNEIQFHDACMELINDIKPDEFDVLIWDTWTCFQKTFHPIVEANPAMFRIKWSPMGTIKGAQMWQEAEKLEAAILNELQIKVPLIILIVHLKDSYIGGQKTGKKIPAHGKALDRICKLKIWTRHNYVSPIPIALILKRYDRKIQVEGKGLRTISILPRKVTPRPWPTTSYLDSQEVHDESIWDTIRWYINNPYGNRNPFPEETPNAFELSILDDTLTDDQRLVLKASIYQEKIEEKVSEELQSLAAVTARELRDEGLIDPLDIVNELRDQVNCGNLVCNLEDINVIKVMSWLKEK